MNPNDPQDLVYRLRQRKRKVSKRLKIIGFFIGLGMLAVGGFILVVAWELPSVAALKNFRPALASEVYSSDHVKIGEFYRERRLWIDYDDVPQGVIHAFLAAEDSDFFEHGGVSFTGILRAAIKNMFAGGVKQGGSTITQQLAKGLLLTPERTITRKVREMVLAFKMERYLTKTQILEIYLNQIFLGHNAYGIRGAANVYYGREPKDLTFGQMAVIAGLSRAPSRDNPVASVEKADQKRKYVLQRMLEEKYITKPQYQQALTEDIRPVAEEALNLNLKYAPYFVEHVRKYLVERYGDRNVLEGGLQIHTTMDSRVALAAQRALRRGVEEVDRHQGFGGAIGRIAEKDRAAFIAALKGDQDAQKPVPDRFYKALVLEVNDVKKVVRVHLGGREAFIALEDMKWARKPNPAAYWEYALIQKPSQALNEGDVVWARLPRDTDPKTVKNTISGLARFVLTQEPRVQGSLLAVDPETGAVRAMVGGYDFKKSEFNRAEQAVRQPGSAFKPIIYTAALDNGYTPASVLLDIPVIYDDPTQDFSWKPKNYAGEFHGDTIFRDCLVQSMNVPTIKIVEDLGLDKIMEYAKRFGIRSPLQRNLSLALGSSAVTLSELTGVYAVFAAGGRKYETEVFVAKIVDRDGEILERNLHDDPSLDLVAQTIVAEKKVLADEAREDATAKGAAGDAETVEGFAISPQSAYIMTHLLKQVISAGTARKAYDVNIPAAGKTGTTNENHDAWFVGYTPTLAAGIWMGYDDASKSLGTMEDGGRVASPVWLEFMKDAVPDGKSADFGVPEGLVAATVDRKTGRLASPRAKGVITEYFKVGTQPSADDGKSPEPAKSDQDFFLQE